VGKLLIHCRSLNELLKSQRIIQMLEERHIPSEYTERLMEVKQTDSLFSGGKTVNTLSISIFDSVCLTSINRSVYSLGVFIVSRRGKILGSSLNELLKSQRIIQMLEERHIPSEYTQ
jgi:GTP-sensing pleiotropic transcriptional regulator CodY